MRLGLNLQHPKELQQTASFVTFSFRIYRDSITEQYMKINIISQNLIGTYMKTNLPNPCLLFVSSKFLQGIESLRIKTNLSSPVGVFGLISTICCRQVQKSDWINSDRQSGSDQLGSTRTNSDRIKK